MKRLFLFVVVIHSVAGYGDLPARDEALYTKTKAALAGKGDFLKNHVARLGNKTLGLDSVASIEGDYKLAYQILSRFDRYPRWIMNHINQSPDGKTYFLQLLGLTITGANPAEMAMQFSLSLPLYTHRGERRYKLTHHEGNGYFEIKAEALPSDSSIIKTSEGIITVYPAEKEKNRLWVSLQGKVTIGPWLLYEAIPERLLGSESGERIQIVLKNYTAEEDVVQSENLKPTGQRKAASGE